MLGDPRQGPIRRNAVATRHPETEDGELRIGMVRVPQVAGSCPSRRNPRELIADLLGKRLRAALLPRLGLGNLASAPELAVPLELGTQTPILLLPLAWARVMPRAVVGLSCHQT